MPPLVLAPLLMMLIWQVYHYNLPRSFRGSTSIAPLGLNMGPPNRNPSLHPSQKMRHTGSNGAVASDVEYCSNLGVDVLKEDGNAADAAVVVALCIGTINMFSSGIGGGAFILLSQNGSVVSINAREQAPMRAHRNMYRNASSSTPNFNETFDELVTRYPSKFGGLSVGIPGELKGLYYLYKTQGSGVVSWESLLNRVADLAENGWEASPLLAQMASLSQIAMSGQPHMWRMLIKL